VPPSMAARPPHRMRAEDDIATPVRDFLYGRMMPPGGVRRISKGLIHPTS